MQNLSDILQAQKQLKNINESIRSLKDIHTIWLNLIQSNIVTKNGFNPALLEKCIPVSVTEKTLNISCQTALMANHLRYTKTALLDALRELGLENIDNINLYVSNIQTNNNDTNKKELKRTVHPETIIALEQFSSSCSSEQLSSSIKKLLQQLKK